MPANTDPFPRRIELRPGRRRTVELSLEGGHFVARIPAGAKGKRLEKMLAELRQQLWEKLRRTSVYSDADLESLGHEVVREHLADLDLPPWTARFSRRQKKRWGSCSCDEHAGRIRISSLLMGHPRWVVASVLLHELCHLVFANHGPRFQALVERSPDHERGRGYLEALENLDRIGPAITASIAIEEDQAAGQANLFLSSAD